MIYFLLIIGNNDLLTAYESKQDVSELISSILTSIYETHNKLIKNGSKNIVLTNIVDLGRTPLFFGKSNQNKMSEISENFNKALQKQLPIMQKSNPLLKFYDLKNNVKSLMNQFE